MSPWSRVRGGTIRGRLRVRPLPPPFGRALAWRVALVWLLMHVGLAVTIQIGGDPGYQALRLNVGQLLWLWGFVVAAILVDMRTRREHLILANLAIPPRLLVVLMVGECAVLDALARLVVLGGSGELRPGG